MLTSKRSLFNLPASVTYLNCAYMSPQLKSVTAAGLKAVKGKEQPFRVQPADFFDPVTKLREIFSGIINNPDPDRIAIIPSVSYGMAIVASNINLKKGENIVVLGEQFPSNVYPWQKLTEEKGAKLMTVGLPQGPDRGKNINQQLLDTINERTKLVAIGNVHWADGTMIDLRKVRKKTKEVGALLVIDGTQSVGALPFDVKKIKPDALICAGYKWLMGPYGIGFAYLGAHFDEGKPLEDNWINRYNSEDFSGLVNYEPRYKSKGQRYSMGEQSNFILLPMMLQALKQIDQWGVENIQAYCQKIGSKVIHEIVEMGYLIENEKFRGHHLFGIRLPETVKMEKLSLALRRAKIYVSIRGNAIRVSPHVYNTEKDMEKLYDSLKKLI